MAGTHRGRRSVIPLGANQILVVSQIALSLLLVIAANLFVRTVANLNSIDLGFNRENILIFNLNACQAGYKDAPLGRYYADMADRFRTIPGLSAAPACLISL